MRTTHADVSEIVVLGNRVPECDNATRHCTLVAASRIGCGGFVRNEHHCPDGYLCDCHGSAPDLPGVCVTESDAGLP